MAYRKDLGFLLRGIDAGALQGEDALAMLMGIQDEREARKQARREQRIAQQQAAAEAQAGLLETLGGTIVEQAGEGTSLESLLPQLQAAQTLAGTPLSSAAGSTLESLVEQTYYPSGGINEGVSRINPTLRPEDAADIVDLTASGQSRDDIHAGLASLYGPKVYNRLIPQVDELISKALGRKMPTVPVEM